ncbi:MAG: L,D-transpeptidase [Gammaproteobacteria bacterium]|nr:L,D-transpeptidase [Gammaproteobacteria bacterium]
MTETSVIIRKTARRLVLSTAGGERGYAVALGKNWAADKAVEGDHATPTGEFYVCAKNPRSKFFLSLCLSYPNAEDARRGLTAGLISPAEHAQILEAIRLRRVPPQHTRLGGEIYIHGRGAAATAVEDWTRGCIALDDAAMQEVYDGVSIGTPVHIVD